MITNGSNSKHNIDINLNLFSKNFGKKIQKVSNSINKSVSNITSQFDDVSKSYNKLNKIDKSKLGIDKKILKLQNQLPLINKGYDEYNSKLVTNNQAIENLSKKYLSMDKRYTSQKSKIASEIKQYENKNKIIKKSMSTVSQQKGVINQEIGGLQRKNKALSLERSAINNRIKNGSRNLKISELTKRTTQKNNWANQGFFKTMRMGLPQFQEMNKSGVKFNKAGGKIANIFRKGMHGMKGFKMEMLGIMFFGMSLTRIMGGLTKTSMDWLGVNEVLTTTLGLLFLPVATLLLDWALQFLAWVGNLSEETKKTIGYFVLFASGLGIALTAIGTLVLGIGSLIMSFGWLLSPITLVIAALAGLAGYAIFKSMFEDTGKSVDNLKRKVVAFGISGEVFDSMKNKIVSWYNIIKEKLYGSKESGDIGFIKTFKNKLNKILYGNKESGEVGLIANLKENVSSAIDKNKEEFSSWGIKIMENLVIGAKKFFKDNPMILIGAIVGGIAIGQTGIAIGSAIGAGLGSINFKNMDIVIEKGLEILDGIIKGLVNNVDKINEFFEALLKAMGNWIGSHGDDLAKIGLSLAKGIIKGMPKLLLGLAKGAIDVGKGIGDEILKLPKYATDLKNNYKNNKVGDAIISPNGNILSTSPQDYLIATKNPSELMGGSYRDGIKINSTYYVTVSDKKEFESMLRESERRVTSDIRRLSR